MRSGSALTPPYGVGQGWGWAKMAAPRARGALEGAGFMGRDPDPIES